MSTVFLFSLLIGFSASVPPSTLRLANVLYRHGDRTPGSTFPTNPNDFETTWPSGTKYLTPLGMKQSYAAGAFLRRRYDGFLSDMYKPSEIRVESSDADRCLMTAYSNLAGLYPPKGYQIWNPKILWQPIPVHTRPTSMDNKLKLGSSRCPRFFQLFTDRLKSPEIMKELASHKDFVDYVYRQAGINAEGYIELLQLRDILYCEQQHNVTWAPWVTSAVFEKMSSLATRILEVLYGGKEQGRLMGGPLLKEIVNNMQSKVDGSLDARFRSFMYSAHGETIHVLMSTLGREHHGAAYTATVMLELHEENGQYNVQMFFRNFATTDVNDTREPTPLIIPGCTLKCPLDKFISITKDSIPVDWKAECIRKTRSPELTSRPLYWKIITSMLNGCDEKFPFKPTKYE